MSVIIPCYNAAGYVGEALASVFDQTYSEYEVIVVNDGSPDTVELERALEPFADRVRYLKQENAGPGGARNAGIRAARGEYVAFLDADDLWEAEFLAEQVRLVEADPTLDLVYADAVLFGDTPAAGRTLMEGSPSSGEASFAGLLRFECTVFTSCVLARRTALVNAGLFDPRFFHSEDFDLWLRLAHNGGRIGYQRKVLARHRAHGESLTAESGALIRTQVDICEKLLRDLPLTEQERSLVTKRKHWCEAQVALMDGKRALMRGAYVEASVLLRQASRTLGGAKLRVIAILAYLAPALLRRASAARQGLPARSLRPPVHGR